MAPMSSAFFLLPGCLPLSEAVSEAAGRAHLGQEMAEFTGTGKQAVRVLTLHTINRRVFTSEFATANARSQPGSPSFWSLPDHELSLSFRPVYVFREGKLKRMSAESVGLPVPQ